MDIQALYSKLSEVYTEKNLNEITAKIIDCYKKKEYDSLHQISKIVNHHLDQTDDAKISVIFSKLIRIYHPDKLKHHLTEINLFFQKKDLENLSKFAHIFQVLEFEENEEVSVIFNRETDYSEEYVWDEDLSDGYQFVDEEHLNDFEQDSDSLDFGYTDHSFLSALKRKMYGGLPIELPFYVLEDITELDMAEYEIDNLEGLEFCRDLVYLDLSVNFITDIAQLGSLRKLEELYLVSNQIGYIDAISNLLNLRFLDISMNEIDDITPLFGLSNLEYVNIIGNKIPTYQIEN